MTHLCIVVAVWQRREIAKIMLDSLAAQAERLSDRMKLSVVVAGSERGMSRRLAEHRGAHYVEVENKPLGRKWQAALKRARRLSPTGVMVLGSDNIVNDELLRSRAAMLELGCDYMGCLDAYQYNPNHRTLIHWNGYKKPLDERKTSREGEPIGSSRTFSATLLDRMKWKIWDEGAHRGLDFTTTQRLKKVEHRDSLLRMIDGDARHLGIKVSGAMSPSLHKNVEGRLDLDLLVDWFGPDIGGRILAL
jgi:hypothetical protein